jgi:hypothetical protein
MPATIAQPDFTTRATVRANAHAVIRFAGMPEPADDDAPLKPVLFAALDRLQALPTPAGDPAAPPLTIFADGQAGDLGRLIDEFCDPPDEGGRRPEPIPSADRASVERLLQEGLALLEAFHPGYASLTHDLVGAVIVAGGVRSISASLSHQIGTVLVNPQHGWTALDYAETLLHESIHEAQYLDQMVVDWYARPFHELLVLDVLVKSPIRRRMRPLPLVLQAACVAAPIVDLRWWAGERAGAVELCAHVIEGLTGVREREELLSDRGRLVLRELADQIAASPVLAAVAADRADVA